MSISCVMKRRDFLTRAALATGVLGSGAWCRFAAAGERGYPFASAEEAFRAADFDPAADQSAFFAVASDCHYGACRDDGLLPIIQELNALRPRPKFFLVDGDLIITASLSFGHRPNDQQKEKAVEEFRKCRRHLDQLDRAIRLKLVLGNHDTHPGEQEPELFHRVFPEHPAYRSFDLAGVHFVLLNGHSDGRIDADQRQWFADDIKAIPSEQEVVTFVHQPSLGSVANEREIAPAYQQAFAEHRGPVWAICGHSHHNGDTVFSLPHTTIVQSSVVCSTEGIWGGPEKPGYWLYLLHAGRVVGRVFRRLGQGYRLGELPDRSQPRPICRPFQFLDGVRWKVLVGDGDRDYLVQHDANDNVTCWCYVRRLVYRLPLGDMKGDVARLAVLGSFHNAAGDDPPAPLLRLSGDRTSWHDMPLGAPDRSVYTFAIPPEIRKSEWLYVEIAKPLKWRGTIHIAGLAFLE